MASSINPQFLEEFAKSVLFYPSLIIVSIIGGICLVLFVLKYLIMKYEDTLRIKRELNGSFFQLIKTYQREMELICKIIGELKRYTEGLGGSSEHDRKFFQKILNGKFQFEKQLEKAHKNSKITKKTLQAAKNFEYFINDSIHQLLEYMEKMPDAKSYTAVLTYYAELKNVNNNIDTHKLAYNRKVKELNTVIRKFPYTLFAAIVGIEPQKTFE